MTFIPKSPLRFRYAIVGAITAAALATVGLMIEPAPPASASTATVTADFSSSEGAPTGVGSGFLYGLGQDGSTPPDSLLQPLDPTLIRGGGARIAGDGWIGDGYTDGPNYQVRITSALDQAARVTAAPYHATYHLLVSDLYGADDTQGPDTIYPCTGGDCSNWVTFIDQVVADVQASAVPVSFDIWNEPDGFPAGMNGTQYFQMWDSAVDAIRATLPDAVIVGPSESYFNSSDIATFLDHTQAAGTLPNVVNWHFSSDPVADASTVQSLLSARSITGVALSMNEYLFASEETPAYEAWYLSRLAKSSISLAAHAIWSSGPDDTLDGILTPSGSDLLTTGDWWVYQRYADLTGNLVSTSGAGGVELTAASDSSAGKASILLGSNNGFAGTATVNLTGLGSASYLDTSSGTVRASVFRLPDQELATPQLVSDSDVSVSSGTATISIPWGASTDAYSVQLTPASTATTVVDGNTTGTSANEFSYSTGWGLSTGITDMYDGTANYSGVTNASSTFSFNGSQVLLHAVRDYNVGIIAVSVDGGPETVIDDYSAVRNASGVVYRSPVMDPGEHTLTVRITGTKNASSSGYADAIDSADVVQSTIVDGNTTTGSADYWSYDTSWGLATGIADMFNNTANYGESAGDTATFSFVGTEVALHAVQDTNAGIISVSIDGGTPTIIDDYSTTREASAVVFTSPTLDAGTHSLSVVITGTKNSASGGYSDAIDRVDIVSP